MLTNRRPAYLDALVKHLPPNITHFHKRCTSVVPSTASPTGNVVHFSDGTTYEADVVIGADGIKSAIRHMVSDSANAVPVFSNTTCFRGLFPMEEARAAGFTIDFKGRPICFASKDKVGIHTHHSRMISSGLQHLIVFGVSNDTMVSALHDLSLQSYGKPPQINVVAFAADYTKPIGSASLPPDEPWVKSVPQEEMLKVCCTLIPPPSSLIRSFFRL